MGKRGPAPRGEYVNKSKVISTRIRQDTRDALEAASKASGRTLSQEIEHRLRRSFSDDQRLAQVFGSRRNFALMRTISSVIENLSAAGEQDDWMKDSDLYDEVVEGINAVLRVIRPSGKAPPQILSKDAIHIELLEQVMYNAGTRIAHAILSEIQSAGPAIPLSGSSREHRFAVIKHDLGEVIARRTIEEGILTPEIEQAAEQFLKKFLATDDPASGEEEEQ